MTRIIETHRKISFAAGTLYLLTFISIPTLSLYKPIRDAGYVTSDSSDTGVIIGVLLEIIMALACIGTAVVLYPLLKKQSETLALGLVASRILEASCIFIGATLILSAVDFHHTSGASPILTSITNLYDRVFLQSQSFLPAINDLLLGILLYKSRLVPRVLSLIGIIGAFTLLIGYGAVMFNVIGQHSSWAGLSALLVALFEFLLGIWLVVKGFNQKSVAALEK